MNDQPLSLKQALRDGWEAFKRYPGLAIGAYVIALLSTATIFLGPPLLGGYCIILLKMRQGTHPRLRDILTGFSSYWKWMKLFWLLSAIAIACSLPFWGLAHFVLYGPTPVHEWDGPGAILALLALSMFWLLLAFVFICAVMIRWIFASFIAVEGAGALESMRRSSQLTEGRRLKLFWIVLALWLLNQAGFIMYFTGAIIITGHIAACALASLYLQLKADPTRNT